MTWVSNWDNGSKVNKLWNGDYFDEQLAGDEGWYIWVDWHNGQPHAYFTTAMGLGCEPSSEFELFLHMQASTGSEYHKLALEIVRRLNAEFRRQAMRKRRGAS